MVGQYIFVQSHSTTHNELSALFGLTAVAVSPRPQCNSAGQLPAVTNISGVIDWRFMQENVSGVAKWL